MKFYLGTHETSWLERTSIPLFISRRRLAKRRRLPRALGSWALDSGGFSELSLHGAWSIQSVDYAREVTRYQQEIGNLEWAAVQDWMCEPAIRERTGLTVGQHQSRTIQSYLELSSRHPGPWLPVLQGWEVDDYLDHIEQYARAKVDLTHVPLVGLGSICRRQSTGTIEGLVTQLHGLGLRLHGFGVKLQGLRRFKAQLVSADSLSWSYWARREGRPMLPGCHTHKNCANCLDYALAWYAHVQRGLAIRQLRLGEEP